MKHRDRKWEVTDLITIDNIRKVYYSTNHCLVTIRNNKFFEIDLRVNTKFIDWMKGSGYRLKLTEETSKEDLEDLKGLVLGMGMEQVERPEEVCTFTKAYVLF